VACSQLHWRVEPSNNFHATMPPPFPFGASSFGSCMGSRAAFIDLIPFCARDAVWPPRLEADGLELERPETGVVGALAHS
jgi:hypothetical protein